MEIYELTAHELADLIRRKEIGVLELTRIFLERIKETEPKIGSYITVCEEAALKRSCEIQEKIDSGCSVSPLAGIPMALKDNLCT